MSLLLYYHTLSHLKARQIKNQILFPLKQVINKFRKFDKYEHSSVHKLIPHYIPEIEKSKKKGINQFRFLNLDKEFNKGVDWNFSEFGKLWNYKLQYLDFLLDSHLGVDERIELLLDLSCKIESGDLVLEPYPVSIRIVNTILFISVYDIENKIISKTLRKQINYLEANLEYHIDGNHLLENAIALRVASMYLNETKLQLNSIKLLEDNLAEQILKDGAHYERSPMYHIQIMHRLGILLGLMNGSEIDYKIIHSTLTQMISWFSTITNEGTLSPQLQDSAGNYLSGFNNLNEFLRSKNILTRNIELLDSGYRFFICDFLRIIINAGNILPSYQPGHAHTDIGSFVLYNDKNPILVDTAVSTYENNTIRQFEKSTSAHNTVMINNMNQSEIWSSFRLGRRAKLVNIHNHKDRLELEIMPYYNSRIKHRRKLEQSTDGFILIDTVIGIVALSEARFHVDHSCKINYIENENAILLNGVRLIFEGATKIKLIDYQQALDFNLRVSAKCIVVEFEKELKTRIHA